MIRSQNHIPVVAALIILLSILSSRVADGQVTGSSARYIQVGPGVMPGVGLHAALVDQQRLYTRDLVFQAHVQPGLFENSGSFQVSGLLGATVRIFGLLETIGAIDPRSYDVHVGARIGPGLTFAFEESSLEKNQRFSLTLEPIARLLKVINRRRYFVEIGIVRPSIRFGMQITL